MGNKILFLKSYNCTACLRHKKLSNFTKFCASFENKVGGKILLIIFCLFQVSWMRHDDTQLLAIGRLTYTSDMRFKAIHKLYSEDYLLQIKPTTHRDNGKYTCQISTTPPVSHMVSLTIAGMCVLFFSSIL